MNDEASRLSDAAARALLHLARDLVREGQRFDPHERAGFERWADEWVGVLHFDPVQPTCVEIERALRAGRSPIAEPGVFAHLATCARCRIRMIQAHPTETGGNPLLDRLLLALRYALEHSRRRVLALDDPSPVEEDRVSMVAEETASPSLRLLVPPSRSIHDHAVGGASKPALPAVVLPRERAAGPRQRAILVLHPPGAAGRFLFDLLAVVGAAADMRSPFLVPWPPRGGARSLATLPHTVEVVYSQVVAFAPRACEALARQAALGSRLASPGLLFFDPWCVAPQRAWWVALTWPLGAQALPPLERPQEHALRSDLEALVRSENPEAPALACDRVWRGTPQRIELPETVQELLEPLVHAMI